MNFQGLVKIETPDFYLDVAYRKATKKLDLKRDTIKSDKIKKSKQLELLRMEIIKESLFNSLNKILTSYPSIDSLPKFYNELVKITLDYPLLKKSLGAVNWCVNNVKKFYNIYQSKIAKTKDIKKINQYRREFNGRVSSLLRQIKKELRYLEEARRVMKEYPAIKTSMPTAVLVGFPNIGKTTLLSRLTGSKPDINSYPFTTKSINISYLEGKDSKVQLLDVPGTLNRFEKMNDIEKQSYLALKYCCDLIVYIIDLTEPYPLDNQMKLMDNLKRYSKEMIVYLSKEDLVDKKTIREFSKKHKCISNPESLSKELFSKARDIKKQSDDDVRGS